MVSIRISEASYKAINRLNYFILSVKLRKLSEVIVKS